MKKNKKDALLTELENYMIVSSACAKLNISRNTVYRWREEDQDFAQKMEKALNRGRDSINDLSESKVVTAIKAGNLRAAEYWLNNNKPNYMKPRTKDFVSNLLKEDQRISKIEIEIVGPRDKNKEELPQGS